MNWVHKRRSSRPYKRSYFSDVLVKLFIRRRYGLSSWRKKCWIHSFRIKSSSMLKAFFPHSLPGEVMQSPLRWCPSIYILETLSASVHSSVLKPEVHLGRQKLQTLWGASKNEALSFHRRDVLSYEPQLFIITCALVGLYFPLSLLRHFRDPKNLTHTWT